MKSKYLILPLIILSIVLITTYMSTQPRIVRVRATTTTSLYATGLLDYLSEEFRKNHSDITIDFIAVGSGEALRRASDGEACLVLVHAPSLEKKYLEQGVIEKKGIFAYNYFIIAGPLNDPAGIKDSASAVEAFRKIYSAGENGSALFISRGDMSGTHIRELSIWSRTGLDPHGRKWYLESGSGMAQTLLLANEKKAYVLSDIGTFTKLSREGRIPSLEILYTNSSELINVYSVYLVRTCSGEERRVAEEFIKFLLGPGQSLIESYGVGEYGVNLFYPARNNIEYLEEMWNTLSKE